MTGRPTKYKTEYAEQARKLCLLGFTDVELAEFFNVAESTLNLWKHEHPEFSESLKKGKVLADVKVVEKLYEVAQGYEVEEEVLNKAGEVVTITKQVPPNPISQMFWLKNRQPDKWKDRKEIRQDINLEGELDVALIESRKRVREAMKREAQEKTCLKTREDSKTEQG